MCDEFDTSGKFQNIRDVSQDFYQFGVKCCVFTLTHTFRQGFYFPQIWHCIKYHCKITLSVVMPAKSNV